MTIFRHTGNILDEVKTGVIVHGCNCLGVMGAGIARQIKERHPHVYEAYTQHVAFESSLGKLIPVEAEPGLIIINAMTQQSTGGKRAVSYDALAECFASVFHYCMEFEYTKIHFPLIGAGLGGGSWPIIQAIIEETVPDVVEKHLWILP